MCLSVETSSPPAGPEFRNTAVFFTAALSNNTLSSRTTVLAIFLVLIVAYAAPKRAEKLTPRASAPP